MLYIGAAVKQCLSKIFTIQQAQINSHIHNPTAQHEVKNSTPTIKATLRDKP